MARVAHAFDAFVDLRKAAMRYRAMTGKTMGEAVKRTMEKLTALAKEGNTINSVRELNKLWLGVADGVFSEMYVSEEYAEIQREFSSAGMKFKIEQQQVLEMLFESLNMPTRSELDDAYKTLYELRREVKALRRQLHVAQETADEVKAGSKGEPATERPSPAEAGPEEAPAAGAAES